MRVIPSPIDPKKAVIEYSGHILTVGDLVARISAGRRSDVRITVRGDVVQSAWEEIRDALGFLSIRIFQHG